MTDAEQGTWKFRVLALAGKLARQMSRDTWTHLPQNLLTLQEIHGGKRVRVYFEDIAVETVEGRPRLLHLKADVLFGEAAKRARRPLQNKTRASLVPEK